MATTVTEPARVATVADRAECSTGGARTNLEWLAEPGVVEQVADDPAMYQRNDAYFDFFPVYRLAREHDDAALERLIDEYEAREGELADASRPTPRPMWTCS